MIEQDHSTPKAEIDERIKKLQRRLMAAEIDGALILQNTDLFYFSGTIQQSHLYIPAQGKPLLMVRKSLARARSESPLSRIVPLNSPKALMTLIQDSGLKPPAVMGMELDVLPANNYFYYRKLFPDLDVRDVSLPIRMVRAVKSDYELALIREAAAFSDQVAEAMPTLLKAGMTEIELAGLVEAQARRLGHQGIVRMRLWGAEMFYGHLMAGPAAAVPSYLASPTGGAAVNAAVAQGPSFRKIRRNEPILLDYVFAWKGYISDHTRIYTVGRPPQKLVAAHHHMLDLQERIKAMATPGTSAGRLYSAAMEIAAEKGLSEHFMGAGSDRIQFIGHGVGLELDEFPFIARGQETRLEEGMVVALEPKLIFPGKGVVGIENTHVVSKDGLDQLTHAEQGIVSV
ncbi:peptidase M24 [Desulfosarcina alkanivorans]|jgi:Xaa-Pro aminopeptidase|uniref:Peptidase M24 n=1 Tax=Desulfosarcina alkanivorans TaxID=571177 RepID=A0A5K7YVT6_9BACT|nr:Xaa-Pro peptidase family protein [Desulfosarcina alkanivorans]BBO72440.1 peptidase M24 [Desulfosarcina alkanivorans]